MAGAAQVFSVMKRSSEAAGSSLIKEGLVDREAVNGQFRRILVSYDGSRESEKALSVALAMAGELGSHLSILAVAQPGQLANGTTLVDHTRRLYASKLGRVADLASHGGIRLETMIAVGHPAEKILERAEREHPDLIVIGRPETSGVNQPVIGSISERVAQHAPCPVLVT